MAINIPNNYDYKSVDLDPIETEVRDVLNVNVENWAKFRHTITASVNADSLHSSLPISNAVKDSYIELSKSHYEAVTMLGATKLSLDETINSISNNWLLFKKSFKEFYMHAGSVLDNIARLIYILNIPDAPIATGNFGKLKRHTIGFGNLDKLFSQQSNHLAGYHNILKNKKIIEIKTIRNNLTHGWPPAIFQDKNTGILRWPTAIRKREQYYLWPHDPREAKLIRKQFRKKEIITEMVKMDWKSLDNFQNVVFKRLTKDVRKFEINHNLTIK